jgi:hypothetical protein
MSMNSQETLKIWRGVLDKYGDWSAVRAASDLVGEVRVVTRSPAAAINPSMAGKQVPVADFPSSAKR